MNTYKHLSNEERHLIYIFWNFEIKKNIQWIRLQKS